jgi:hypothetical protein
MYVILFPGVVLHEFSHILACKIVGVKITNVKFFSYSGGYVEYVAKKNNYFKNFFISVAPLIVGIGIVFLIVRSIGGTSLSVVEVIRKIILSYLAISVFFGLFPSFKDFQNAWIGYLMTIAILAVFRLKIFSNLKINEGLFFVSIATILILFTMTAVLKIYRSYTWR